MLNTKTILSSSIVSLMDNASSNYFSKANKRYFGSRMASKEAYSNDLNNFYFVTSEQFNSDNARLYTIRRYNHANKIIETFGEFQGYKSAKKAMNAIKSFLV